MATLALPFKIQLAQALFEAYPPDSIYFGLHDGESEAAYPGYARAKASWTYTGTETSLTAYQVTWPVTPHTIEVSSIRMYLTPNLQADWVAWSALSTAPTVVQAGNAPTLYRIYFGYL